MRIGLLSVLVTACLTVLPGAAARQVPHVILVSLDGLKPSTYTDPAPPAMPTLRQLAASGSAAKGVIGVLPTVTFPSHTTLISGVTPAIHGIVDNRIVDPEGRARAGWFWYAAQLQAPTLIGASRAANLTTAAVNWPVTVGSDAHFLVPEYERSPHPEGRIMLDALSTPGLLEAVEIARAKPLPWPFDDDARTDIALHILKTHRPHLMVLHLLRTDSAQHDHGPGSAQATEAAESMDRQIARLVRTLDETGLRKNTVLAIVSDHGFLPYQRVLHPNALFKQEGLLTTNAAGTITAWQAYFHSSGGAGFVYLREDTPALRERVGSVLKKLQQNPEAGIENLWSAQDLAAAGSHPEAAFGFDMKNGWYTGFGTETLIVPAEGPRGGHGFAPSRRELHASLILNGPGIPKRDLGVVKMTQIAPTLAQILGVSLSPRADTPLVLTP